MALSGAYGFNPNIPSTRSCDQSPYQSFSTYPDAETIDRGGLRDRSQQSRAVPGSGTSPTILQSQSEPARSTQEEINRSVTRSSKKRTRVDAEDKLGDATIKSQRSTRRSKRTKTSSDAVDEVELRIRKTSKLKVNIAQGKAPKRGLLGPNWRDQERGDQMESEKQTRIDAGVSADAKDNLRDAGVPLSHQPRLPRLQQQRPAFGVCILFEQDQSPGPAHCYWRREIFGDELRGPSQQS